MPAQPSDVSSRGPLASRGWIWFAVALAVQLAIIGGLVASAQGAKGSGRAVYLEVTPFDPRDPMRGDYVTFTYPKISTLGKDLFFTGSGFASEGGFSTLDIQTGQQVWVPLTRVGKTWEAQPGVTTVDPASIKPDRLPYPAGTPVLRGVVESVDGSQVRVKYGIEEYFVPEGTGASWPTGTTDAVARVLVTGDGRSTLDRILIGGKPWPSAK